MVKKGLFPWTASGRAIANGRDEGVTKLLFDDSPEAGSEGGHAGRGHGKILGGGTVGTHAGDMIGEISLGGSQIGLHWDTLAQTRTSQRIREAFDFLAGALPPVI